MGGYIRLDKDQPNDTRLVDLAESVAQRWSILEGETALDPIVTRHVLRHAVTGALVTLWTYADTHIRRDNSLPVTLAGVTQIVNLPVSILELFPPCWLRVRADGMVVLPDYCRKNGIRARDLRKEDRDGKVDHQRELARNRKQKQRDKSRRDTLRDGHAVTPPTGTGTGTHPIPVPRPESKPDSESRGELASAQGRLARRDGQAKNGKAATTPPSRPAKSPEELGHDIEYLADQGLSSDDIARMLTQYGVTAAQVAQRLESRQPAKEGTGS